MMNIEWIDPRKQLPEVGSIIWILIDEDIYQTDKHFSMIIVRVTEWNYRGLEVEMKDTYTQYNFFYDHIIGWSLYDQELFNNYYSSFGFLQKDDLYKYPQIQQAIKKKEDRDRAYALRQKDEFIPADQALPDIGEKVVVGSNNMFFIVEYTGQSPWISPHGGVITCWYPIPQTLNNRPIKALRYTD